MRTRFVLLVLAGVAVVAGGVAWLFYIQRGAHMELTGSVLKVRTAATDENSCVALIDFRVANRADYVWMVRSVSVAVIDEDGYRVDGSTISDQDAARLFDYFPLLGQKFNESLVIRSKIGPRQTLDRMIGARFEIPEAKLEKRRSLTITIEEVDGAVSEIREEAGGQTR